MLWWRIVDDIISENESSNLKLEESRILNRIFSSEKVVTNFFTNSEHVERVVFPLLDG